jgi:hypothetical protein
MTPAIALIIFNRPGLTAQLYARIRAIKPSRLFIIADGPRTDKNGGSTIGIATRELDISTHPVGFVPNREADSFTFKEHIAPKKAPLISRIISELRVRLQLRARLKSISFPRSIPNVALPAPSQPHELQHMSRRM